MNPYTGEIHEVPEHLAQFIKTLVPVERDLTALEKFNKQINLYSLCGCGSGKKFKFCCHKEVTP
jgi:uncharacterized protein YchJ